jgi:hypothetical protein
MARTGGSSPGKAWLKASRPSANFNIYEVQRMMGHRHITTTERYLHYAPDPDAAAKLSRLWHSEGSTDNVVSIRSGGVAFLWGALGEPWPSRRHTPVRAGSGRCEIPGTSRR